MTALCLTPKQARVLRYLKTQPEGARPVWVAEGCGHFHDANWPTTALKALTRKGLIDNPTKGWYVINEKGQTMLEETDHV